MYSAKARVYELVMNPAFDVRVLLPDHKETLQSFSKSALAKKISDPMELEMQSWTAPWRSESLDHYLKQGWSYGLFVNDQLHAYLLAQPFLFYRGLTQTLWIEYIEDGSTEETLALVDTAYRWARDKHFQCLLVEAKAELLKHLQMWKSAQKVDAELIEIRSAKF